MTKFSRGNRVKVALDATFLTLDGGAMKASYNILGQEVFVNRESSMAGNVTVFRFGGAAEYYVDPKFLTLVTDEPEAPVLVEVEDLSTLTEGQAVTLEARSDGTRIAAIFEYNGGHNIGARLAGGVAVNVFNKSQWRVLVEKPKVELPMENGPYLDKAGGVVEVTDGCYEWVGNLGPHNLEFDKEREYIESRAPYRRLVPEGSERNRAIRDVQAVATLHYDSTQIIKDSFPEAFEEEK